MNQLTEEGKILIHCTDYMAQASEAIRHPAFATSIWAARHRLREAAECAERGMEKNCAGHLRMAAQNLIAAANAVDRPDEQEAA